MNIVKALNYNKTYRQRQIILELKNLLEISKKDLTFFEYRKNVEKIQRVIDKAVSENKK